MLCYNSPFNLSMLLECGVEPGNTYSNENMLTPYRCDTDRIHGCDAGPQNDLLSRRLLKGVFPLRSIWVAASSFMRVPNTAKRVCSAALRTPLEMNRESRACAASSPFPAAGEESGATWI